MKVLRQSDPLTIANRITLGKSHQKDTGYEIYCPKNSQEENLRRNVWDKENQQPFKMDPSEEIRVWSPPYEHQSTQKIASNKPNRMKNTDCLKFGKKQQDSKTSNTSEGSSATTNNPFQKEIQTEPCFSEDLSPMTMRANTEPEQFLESRESGAVSGQDLGYYPSVFEKKPKGAKTTQDEGQDEGPRPSENTFLQTLLEITRGRIATLEKNAREMESNELNYLAEIAVLKQETKTVKEKLEAKEKEASFLMSLNDSLCRKVIDKENEAKITAQSLEKITSELEQLKFQSSLEVGNPKKEAKQLSTVLSIISEEPDLKEIETQLKEEKEKSKGLWDQLVILKKRLEENAKDLSEQKNTIDRLSKEKSEANRCFKGTTNVDEVFEKKKVMDFLLKSQKKDPHRLMNKENFNQENIEPSSENESLYQKPNQKCNEISAHKEINQKRLSLEETFKQKFQEMAEDNENLTKTLDKMKDYAERFHEKKNNYKRKLKEAKIKLKFFQYSFKEKRIQSKRDNSAPNRSIKKEGKCKKIQTVEPKEENRFSFGLKRPLKKDEIGILVKKHLDWAFEEKNLGSQNEQGSPCFKKTQELE